MAATTPETYLAQLSPEQRATLEKVRAAIRKAAPAAQEGMSYGMPAFIQGRPIAGYAASAKHCAFYPMSGSVIAALGAELAGYETSKGAVRFPIGKPLSVALVRKLVKARLDEIAAASASAKPKDSKASAKPSKASAKPKARSAARSRGKSPQ